MLLQKMKSGDDGFFVIDHTGHDLEENFTGVLSGVVHVGTAERHLPYLRMQGFEFQRGKIGVGNRFADRFDDGFAGRGKVFFR